MKHGKLEVFYHSSRFMRTNCWCVSYAENGYEKGLLVHHFNDPSHKPNWRWILPLARKCRAQVKQWISEEVTQ